MATFRPKMLIEQMKVEGLNNNNGKDAHFSITQ